VLPKEARRARGKPRRRFAANLISPPSFIFARLMAANLLAASLSSALAFSVREARTKSREGLRPFDRDSRLHQAEERERERGGRRSRIIKPRPCGEGPRLKKSSGSASLPDDLPNVEAADGTKPRSGKAKSRASSSPRRKTIEPATWKRTREPVLGTLHERPYRPIISSE